MKQSELLWSQYIELQAEGQQKLATMKLKEWALVVDTEHKQWVDDLMKHLNK